jgi:hypothetical protein
MTQINYKYRTGDRYFAKQGANQRNVRWYGGYFADPKERLFG